MSALIRAPRPRSAAQPTVVQWWKILALFAAVGVLFFGGAGTAAACRCALPENRQGALDRLSRFDVVFEGTLVRTFPGVAEYKVDKVYAGDLAERVLVTSPDRGSSCTPGQPQRGHSRLFLGNNVFGPIAASETSMCGYSLTQFQDGQSAELSELAQSVHGQPSAARHTPASWALALVEWPLTWLADRRIQVIILVLAIAGCVTRHVRSR